MAIPGFPSHDESQYFSDIWFVCYPNVENGSDVILIEAESSEEAASRAFAIDVIRKNWHDATRPVEPAARRWVTKGKSFDDIDIARRHARGHSQLVILHRDDGSVRYYIYSF